jgi:transposase
VPKVERIGIESRWLLGIGRIIVTRRHALSVLAYSNRILTGPLCQVGASLELPNAIGRQYFITDSAGEVEVPGVREYWPARWGGEGRGSSSFEEWCVLRPVGVPEIPVETAVLARRVHPRGADEMRVRDALGPLFGDEDFTAGEFADMYPRLGQPGLPPALLLMVTILQFRHNLSDREAAQAVADRISWKYALGLELDYTGFDASVLCEFRARLAEGGRADALLDGMLERLKAAGLVRAGGRVRTDSTHVLACVRRPGPDRDPRRGPARRLGGDRPDQSRLDRAAAAAGLGRALRPQGGDRPAAWPQARLRRQADRADRCRRPAPARRGRCRPGRGLDQRPAPGEDPARPVGSVLPAHARRASALQGRRRAAPGRPAHPLAL